MFRQLHHTAVMFPYYVDQVFHNVTENPRVQIFTQHAEEEPVSDPTTAVDLRKNTVINVPETLTQNVNSEFRTCYYANREYEPHGSEDQEHDEPEPQERVNLPVQGVQWQHAQRIIAKQIPRNADIAENALHRFRKDVRHGVLSALVIACHEAQDSGAVGPKFAPEEMIHEEHLACKKKVLSAGEETSGTYGNRER